MIEKREQQEDDPMDFRMTIVGVGGVGGVLAGPLLRKYSASVFRKFSAFWGNTMGSMVLVAKLQT